MNRPQNLPTAYACPIPIMYRAQDRIIHTNEHPFCGDWRCPCHFDEDHVMEYHTLPYRRGLLTWDEAGRLLYGQQI